MTDLIMSNRLTKTISRRAVSSCLRITFKDKEFDLGSLGINVGDVVDVAEITGVALRVITPDGHKFICLKPTYQAAQERME